ncbi:hypothetical protein FOCC_FOCC013176 [Frankliniella occidentalis]|nr:hypothetical protein FOCC_FOCC013176 [Frankliniella occidentalis]
MVHNHLSSPYFAEFCRQWKVLQEQAVQQDWRQSLSSVYDGFMSNIQDPFLRKYFKKENLLNHVQYVRSRRLPRSPRFLQEAEAILMDSDNRFMARTEDDNTEFYQGIVGQPEEESLVFASKRMLAILQNDDVIQGDDTYKIRPYINKSKHVFIVSVYHNNQMYPLAYAVMTRGTSTAYAAVLQKLKELGLRGQAVVTDWDDGQRKGWKEAFPNMKQWGCYFHFLRAMYRNAKGLQKFLTTSTGLVSRVLRMLAAIPRLEAEHMLEAFDIIWSMASDLTNEQATEQEVAALLRYLQYFKREWLSGNKPADLSVKGRVIHTTSGQESLHRQLNTSLNNYGHPSFWKFLTLIRRLEHKAYYDYNTTIETGTTRTTHRTKRLKTKPFNHRDLQFDKDITTAYKDWTLNKNIKDFLTLAAHGVREQMEFFALFHEDLEVPE